jgi:uncharacterized SAM-binding protein YcdF (DUF218 family)
MPAFLYSSLLSLLNPLSIAFLLLIAAALLPRRPVARRTFFGLALALILIGGNRWIVAAMLRSLEGQFLPPTPIQSADAIVVLSGGTLPRLPPRPTVEVTDAGDRVLYAAELFRLGRAPLVIVSGDVATGGVAPRSAAEDIAELLERVGVPGSAIVLERKARNTHEHALLLCPVFRERNLGRVLLVTSAIHMPRSLGVFRHACGSVDYIPAPTDFRTTDGPPAPWYRQAVNLLPTSSAFVDFTDAGHEYLGILYYHLRGWL